MSSEKIIMNDSPIAKAKERAAQLKRQKILQENRENEKQCRIDTRRYFIIGEMFSNYFSEVSSFQPKVKEADTKKEFAELENFFFAIANDAKYAVVFREIIRNKMGNKR